MEITNEQTEETPRLTIADLGVAAWACSELFNYMLEGYEQEDYGELSKEQMEQAMNKLRATFVKFDALADALTKGEQSESEHKETTP
jgi:DNA repair protein RadC|tara:strand:- start:2689 stop:2949 length:261 start_codon:yes stop_codon:yes gene_type:complete